MLLMRARVEGINVAADMPRVARAAISMIALVEKAAKTEAMAKAVAPIIKSLRLPMRSPSVPMVMRKPAIMKP